MPAEQTIILTNKKVLLRERKRHTARHVASAHYAGEGGIPHPVMVGGTPSRHVGGVPHPGHGGGGYPIQVMVGRGTPSSHGGEGYPIQSWGGTPGIPHHPDLGWVTPHHPDLARGGTLGNPPTIQTWDGVPPNHPDLGWGTPHHPDLGWGTPHPDHGWGTPPQPSRPGMGYPPTQTWDEVPPPPPMVNRQTFPSINITFPRTTYAGGNKVCLSSTSLRINTSAIEV